MNNLFVKTLMENARKLVAGKSLLTEDFSTNEEDARMFWRGFGVGNKATKGRLNWNKRNMWWEFASESAAATAEKRLKDIVPEEMYDILVDGKKLRLGWKEYDPFKDKKRFIKRGKVDSGLSPEKIARYEAMRQNKTPSKAPNELGLKGEWK